MLVFRYVYLLILIPAFYSQVVDIYFTESKNKGTGKPGVCNKWDIIIDCTSAYCIIVIQLFVAQVFWYINYKIHFARFNQVDCIWRLVFVGPIRNMSFDTCLCKELLCSSGGIKLMTSLAEGSCTVQEFNFRPCRTSRKEYALFGNSVTNRKH